MANEEQLSILKQGVEVWNKWREKNIHEKIDLSEINLSNTDLSNADLSDADLSGSFFLNANLSGSNLVESNLWYAAFEKSNLIKADLSKANLRNAFLNDANLTQAYLTGANLDFTHLNNSNLTQTIANNTTFANLDLSQVVGLQTMIHKGPSTLGTNTIINSKGTIPDAFLRGCGLSDLEIEFTKLSVPGLDPRRVTDITYKIHQLYLGGGIQYYSCFISYSSKDQEFAHLLHDDLQNNGVRCWFDREDLKIGDAIRPTIDRQIRLRDKLLVILSENSIKSEWVGDEVEGALEEEQKGNRSVLFPIRLDDTVLNTRDDWAAKIKRRRHIGDFSNWKDKNSYQKSFERLLRDLKAAD